MLISTVAARLTVPPVVKEGSISPHCPELLVLLFFFYKGHSSRGEVMAPCGFDLHLPYN